MKFTRSPLKLNHGFTLIEVLVASVILFSVIATVSMVYRGAFISSEQANKQVNIIKVLPSVLATIKQQVQQQSNLSNDTELQYNSQALNVVYSWKATLIQSKSAPAQFEMESGKVITGTKKYKLWLVKLTLLSKGLTKEYEFNEMSWKYD